MQILINLLTNAIKYTNEGFIHVEVSQPHDQKFCVTIKDSGIGMTSSQLQSLFKPFAKIVPNRNFNNDGVGLGLSVCLNLAQAMHGEINVNSKVFNGSTFSLLFPIKQEPKIMLNEDDMILQNNTLFPYRDWLTRAHQE